LRGPVVADDPIDQLAVVVSYCLLDTCGPCRAPPVIHPFGRLGTCWAARAASPRVGPAAAVGRLSRCGWDPRPLRHTCTPGGKWPGEHRQEALNSFPARFAAHPRQKQPVPVPMFDAPNTNRVWRFIRSSAPQRLATPAHSDAAAGIVAFPSHPRSVSPHRGGQPCYRAALESAVLFLRPSWFGVRYLRWAESAVLRISISIHTFFLRTSLRPGLAPPHLPPAPLFAAASCRCLRRP